MAQPPLVRVLGIAQDGGHPQAGCTRPCCAEVWAGRAPGHLVASLGIVDGDRRFLVDCTPDLRAQLWSLGGPPLHGILLTHAHMGHYTGLLHLGKEAWAPARIPVYVMPGMRAFLLASAPWSALIGESHIELVDLVADEPLALSDRVTVTPRQVPHRGPWTETVGFEIEGPSRRVLFVPDIDGWDGTRPTLRERVEAVDVAYVDGSFFDRDEIVGRDPDEIPHPFIRDTMDTLQSSGRDLRIRVRFLHLNHTNPALHVGSAAWHEVHDRGFRIAVEGEQVEL